jgi:hypothetical protein
MEAIGLARTARGRFRHLPGAAGHGMVNDQQGFGREFAHGLILRQIVPVVLK